MPFKRGSVIESRAFTLGIPYWAFHTGKETLSPLFSASDFVKGKQLELFF
jgi:hypothetical protein